MNPHPVSPPTIQQPVPPESDFAERIAELQRRIDTETSLTAKTDLYREMTEILEMLNGVSVSHRIDRDELRDLRRRTIESAGLDPKAPPADLKDELKRCREVAEIIRNLSNKLRDAAAAGEDRLDVMIIDRSVAHRAICFGWIEAAPKLRDHLHSPAYLRLWDHLCAQGFEPYIELPRGHLYSRIFVNLPR